MVLAAAPLALANDRSHGHEYDGHGGYYDGYRRAGPDHGRYTSDRDRYDRYGHGYRPPALGHAVGDLFRYGTTNPYSSPRHYYDDEHRANDRYQRDQHGARGGHSRHDASRRNHDYGHR